MEEQLRRQSDLVELLQQRSMLPPPCGERSKRPTDSTADGMPLAACQHAHQPRSAASCRSTASVSAEAA